MNTPNEAVKNRKKQAGSATVLMAVMGVAMAGFAAMVLDGSYMMVTRSELQNAADAAASSGNMALARIHIENEGADPTEYELTSGDRDKIIAAAAKFAKLNQAAQVSIDIAPADVKIGKWLSDTRTFEETTTGPTAVRVIARRDGIQNGPVETLMASVIGHNNFTSRADSAAAISPVGRIPAGKIDFPVGISRHWFESRDSPCGPNSQIKFYPTGNLEGCAGWHTFQKDPSNAFRLKFILDEMAHGRFQSPEIIVGETELMFTGGTVDSALKEAQDLFNATAVDGEMLVHLPVYDYDDCANPQGWIKIVGIVTAIITEIDPHGEDKRVDAHVSCDVVGFGSGGGPDYGTYAAAPQIVN